MTILLVIVVVLVIAGFPAWPYSRSWGYGPSGVAGLVLLLLILWLLFGARFR